MRAYSPSTGMHYEDWDALVAAEANGYAVVIQMKTVSQRPRFFVRTVGPFPRPRRRPGTWHSRSGGSTRVSRSHARPSCSVCTSSPCGSATPSEAFSGKCWTSDRFLS